MRAKSRGPEEEYARQLGSVTWGSVGPVQGALGCGQQCHRRNKTLSDVIVPPGADVRKVGGQASRDWVPSLMFGSRAAAAS